MAYDLDNLESFEESNSRKYLKWAEHENKTLLVELLNVDAERPDKFAEGRPSKQVQINAIVNNGDGTFSEYFGQWMKGAVIFGFLSKRKRGEIFIRKLVKLPPSKPGNQPAWALNATDQDSFDATLEYAKNKQAEEQAAVESLGDEELPWEQEA